MLNILFDWFDNIQQYLIRLIKLYQVKNLKEKGIIWSVGLLIMTLLVVWLVLGFLWSREPSIFNVREKTQLVIDKVNEQSGKQYNKVVGATTTATLISVTETLLNKPGGYLSNDVMPPGIFLDNIPNWEYGVLVQVRDMARVLRNDFSMAQSTSTEDKDLSLAEPAFNNDSEKWLWPASESKYQEGINYLYGYLGRLLDTEKQNAQFFARADNLVDWLQVVEKRLGSLSQRLSASVGQERINTDLAGDAQAQQATHSPDNLVVKTSWFEIDDVFYEARGTSWALVYLLYAIEHDFKSVLKKKNARLSILQIIRELEATQASVWSPIILNGSGFGMTANHSLVMASYISRANTAIIDLKRLLKDG
ncbi:MAG: DUF2333 family protein [gamma proteobacterium symbiont of Lucinoma myriamae]|nr:DUF2333 family protein [gamma proteobacterium symbiont of Lucinoma myriamae]MCU7817943.1 DUF2333 family protein [gamma proteobacterium symbiont of Lucinoma myriamae]